ncbi:hypothetical protein BO78DRAFT_129057 [Aspergillus sclerotiicarbonarius CBS 121057]|uniref:Uncharacterized protein n=1 Tax=Aspergillus sclerotiicarbonarius (strain CBS 121057 / IBT 28362) TaxID=1448318 RepID=A0A319E7H6_ASPSB|nr:hypothetical protein BO78DRAFT_129057 [Aspergillus sclerotiicarbonarius CBS 121057]
MTERLELFTIYYLLLLSGYTAERILVDAISFIKPYSMVIRSDIPYDMFPIQHYLMTSAFATRDRETIRIKTYPEVILRLSSSIVSSGNLTLRGGYLTGTIPGGTSGVRSPGGG